MERFIYSLILVFLVCMTMARSSYAQNSPQDFLDAHNAARAEVGVEPLTWDAFVAAYEETYAKQMSRNCTVAHAQDSLDSRNLFAGYGKDYTAKDAVYFWVVEKEDYDYDSNTCAAGKLCGHYLQVVWSNSTRLGCARVRCSQGGWFISCNYDPPGNIIGQRPYYKNSNSCPKQVEMCGSRTQVWHNSASLGSAAIMCDDTHDYRIVL